MWPTTCTEFKRRDREQLEERSFRNHVAAVGASASVNLKRELNYSWSAKSL